MNFNEIILIVACLFFYAILFNIASWLMKIHRELVEIKKFSKADFEDRRTEMIKRL